MAHLLQITADDAAGIELATGSGTTGIFLRDFIPPAPRRRVERVGRRTVAAAYEDVEATIRCVIRDTTIAGVDQQLKDLYTLLKKANQWVEEGTETAVQLAWRRQGETLPTYWAIEVATYPEMVAEDATPLDVASLTFSLEIEFTLLLAPWPRDAAPGTIGGHAQIPAPSGVSTTQIAGTIVAGTYYYQVTAYNSRGETVGSTEVSRTLAVTAGIRISWSAVTGATGYRVYGRMTGASKARITQTASTSYDDTSFGATTTTLPTTNTTAMSNQPLGNYAQCTGMLGPLPGPASVRLTYTDATAQAVTEFWLAQLAGTPDLWDYTAVVDATGYGGSVTQVTAGGTALNVNTTGGTLALDAKHRYPQRFFVRLKPTSGVAAKLQVRYKMRCGQAWEAVGDWKTFPGILNTYALMDLGQCDLAHLWNFHASVTRTIRVSLEYRTSDASAVNATIDYIEALPIRGLTKITNALAGNNYKIYYDDIGQKGNFYYARRTPIAYTLTAANALDAIHQPAGRLGFIPGSDDSLVYIWAAWQRSTLWHRLTDSADLSVLHLATHALGMVST